FIFFRLAILRRAAFHHVADVNIAALPAHGFDHLCEQFSGAPDKRKALLVFINSRTFSHEHQLCLVITVAADDFVSGALEFAAGAVAKVFTNLQKRFARSGFGGSKERWAGTKAGKIELGYRSWRGGSRRLRRNDGLSRNWCGLWWLGLTRGLRQGDFLF